MNKNKISYDFLNERKLAFQKLEKEYDQKIRDRITYILDKICQSFDSTLDTWWFPDAKEGEVGSFEKSYDKQFVYISMMNNNSKSKPGISKSFKIKYGEKESISLKEKFPYSWLFTDFEEDLLLLRDNYKKESFDKIYNKLSNEEKEILKDFYI